LNNNELDQSGKRFVLFEQMIMVPILDFCV